MVLIEETSVPDADLPVDAFKAHLRLGRGFGNEGLQDAVLHSFLRAAMAAIEARTGKVLLVREFVWTLSFWRASDAQVLPVAPIALIRGVKLVAREGTETLIDASAYWLENDMHRPRLRSVASTLPRIPQAGSVVIGFDAGFGADWSAVPPDLQQAVFLLAAHYYEYRNDMGLSEGCMPFGVSSLIERYKSFRLGSGAVR